MVFGDGSAWSPELQRRDRCAIDPATNEVVATIDVSRGPLDGPISASTPSGCPTTSGDRLHRDPATNEVVDVITVEGGTRGRRGR